MKSLAAPARAQFTLLLLFACAVLSLRAPGQVATTSTNSSQPKPVLTPEEKEKASLEKHAKPILADLKLADPAAVEKVHQAVLAHYRALHAWHQTNDARLRVLWNDFNQAHGKLDQPKTDAAAAQIADTYSSFKA